MTFFGIKSSGRDVNLAWLVVGVLYASCWFLPIQGNDIGFDGAEFAHKEFWKLLTEGPGIDTLGDVFGAVFISIGWLANELFVLGLVTLWKWPHLAVRLFALSLGIMISWQIVFLKEFPLLVGYWFWIASGTAALGLAAARLTDSAQTNIRAVPGGRITLALFLAPALNAAIVAGLGLFEK